jgi:hypothetical protein
MKLAVYCSLQAEIMRKHFGANPLVLLPSIDTARERFQLQHYLDSMEQVDSEQASEVDNAAVTLFLLLHPPLRAFRGRSLFLRIPQKSEASKPRICNTYTATA